MNRGPIIYDIRPVLSHYGVDIKGHRTGWQKILCPVHGESNESCSLNTATNYMACHACGFAGHTIDLIMALESCSREAAKSIAESIAGCGGEPLSRSTGWRSGNGVPGRSWRQRGNRI